MRLAKLSELISKSTFARKTYLSTGDDPFSLEEDKEDDEATEKKGEKDSVASRKVSSIIS